MVTEVPWSVYGEAPDPGLTPVFGEAEYPLGAIYGEGQIDERGVGVYEIEIVVNVGYRVSKRDLSEGQFRKKVRGDVPASWVSSREDQELQRGHQID